jgi:pyruvate ferredoxin oxidoreductase gamma subunit
MASIDIRWHGRGGQGVKTAASLLAEVGAGVGKFAQGFPEYGPERAGAPVRGFTRIADSEIRTHCAIARPDVVVVFDTSLFAVCNITEGLPPGGSVIANTPMCPADLRKTFGLPACKLYTVDASGIATAEVGRPVPNIPLIGAVLKVTGAFSVEEMKKDIRKKLGRKFGEKVAEGNIRALDRAFNELKTES